MTNLKANTNEAGPISSNLQKYISSYASNCNTITRLLNSATDSSRWAGADSDRFRAQVTDLYNNNQVVIESLKKFSEIVSRVNTEFDGFK